MSGRDMRTLGNAEAHLLLTLASQDRQVFTTSDAQAAIGGQRHRANKILARLSNKRWVLRLQRGLYLILPFEAGVEGTYSVHPFRVAPHLATPYVIAYWTALGHYGYTVLLDSEVVRLCAVFMNSHAHPGNSGGIGHG